MEDNYTPIQVQSDTNTSNKLKALVMVLGIMVILFVGILIVLLINLTLSKDIPEELQKESVTNNKDNIEKNIHEVPEGWTTVGFPKIWHDSYVVALSKGNISLPEDPIVTFSYPSAYATRPRILASSIASITLENSTGSDDGITITVTNPKIDDDALFSSEGSSINELISLRTAPMFRSFDTVIKTLNNPSAEIIDMGEVDMYVVRGIRAKSSSGEQTEFSSASFIYDETQYTIVRASAKALTYDEFIQFLRTFKIHN